MQIRSNPYPIRFDRVDNPIEAMVAPSVDSVSGLITGKMLDRLPVIDIHNTIQAPDGSQTEMFYRMEKMPDGIRIRGQAGGETIEEFVDTRSMSLQMQGRIGGSQERLVVTPTMGGFVYEGQIGDVPVRQQLGLDPWTLGFQLAGQFGPALLQLVGSPVQDGTKMALQGSLDGRPVSGTIEGGQVPDSMIITRDVDGYQWVQEIRGKDPSKEPAPPAPYKWA